MMNRKHVPALVAYIVVALVASIVIADRADAVAEDATPTPVVKYPLYPTHYKGVAIRVQVEAPAEAWGIRKFAREVDPQLPGVRIHTRGTCEDRPRAVCVRVNVADFGATPWLGQAHVGSQDRAVDLNTHYGNTYAAHHYAAAAHELTHALGLGHHAKRGVVGGWPDVIHLSWVEKRALRQAYP